MDFKLRNLKLKYKLLTLAACALVGMAILVSAAVTTLKKSIVNERLSKTRSLVEAAHSTIKHYHSYAQNGEMSDQEARAAAMAAIGDLRYDRDEYFWINDMQCIMLMHPKAELIGKDMSSFRDPSGKELFRDFVAIVKADKRGFSEYRWLKPGAREPSPKISYVMGFEPWNWVIGTGIYIDDINATFWEKMRLLALISLVSIGLILTVSWRVSNSVTRPMAEGVGVAERVSQGDLTCTIEDCGTDEIGQLMSAKRDMVDKLKDIIIRVRESADNVSSASHQLSASSNEMSLRVSEQASLSAHIATASEEMGQTVLDIARNSAAIAKDATTTMKTAEDGRVTVSEAVEEVRTIAGSMADMGNCISALDDQSRQIGTIVNVIKDIADQTNLLALNAAIEAARAGEQGRGFSVVADEVRKLAEQSVQATARIQEMIRETQKEVQSAVTTMSSVRTRVETGVELSGKAGEALQTIVTGVQTLHGRVLQIASATEEMTTVADQIGKNIQTVADGSNDLSNASNQIAQSSSDLSRLSDHLKGLVSRFKT